MPNFFETGDGDIRANMPDIQDYLWERVSICDSASAIVEQVYRAIGGDQPGQQITEAEAEIGKLATVTDLGEFRQNKEDAKEDVIEAIVPASEGETVVFDDELAARRDRADKARKEIEEVLSA